MVSLKLNVFGGMAPKYGVEDLKESYAEISDNVNLYSSDLIPYRKPKFIERVPDGIKHIFPLYTNDNSIKEWVKFSKDVDVVPSTISDTNQRFYVTGNGRPKVSDKDTYPVFYDLGIPKPRSVPVATVGAGGTPPALARVYVYTFVSEWGEEGQPSDPSPTVNANDGAIVTITNIQTSQPALIFIGTIELASDFPTSSSVSVHDYYRITADVTDNDVTKTNTGQAFKVGDNIEWDGISWKKLAETIFSTNITKKRIYRTSDIGSDADYQFVAEIPISQSTYVDTVLIADLVEPLATIDYRMAPEFLSGLIFLPNGIFVGFSGKEIFFSEPYLPHAWPEKYALSVESNIIGLAPNGGTSFIVCTNRYPYQCTGNTPDVMTLRRIEVDLPCASKRSIVDMGRGAMYASSKGLVFSQEYAGTFLKTKDVHDWETFEPYAPQDFTSVYYDSKYMASYVGGSIVYDLDQEEFITNVQQRFDAAYYDARNAKMYYVWESAIYEFDSREEGKLTYRWRSKKFRLNEYSNMGAARIIADFEKNMVDKNTSPDGQNDLLVNPTGAINTKQINGTNCAINGSEIKDMGSSFGYISGSGVCLFLLYVDGRLVFKRYVQNNKIFRLPLGYKSDNFQIEIRANIRVREIHVAETPIGLKQI